MFLLFLISILGFAEALTPNEIYQTYFLCGVLTRVGYNVSITTSNHVQGNALDFKINFVENSGINKLPTDIKYYVDLVQILKNLVEEDKEIKCEVKITNLGEFVLRNVYLNSHSIGYENIIKNGMLFNDKTKEYTGRGVKEIWEKCDVRFAELDIYFLNYCFPRVRPHQSFLNNPRTLKNNAQPPHFFTLQAKQKILQNIKLVRVEYQNKAIL